MFIWLLVIYYLHICTCKYYILLIYWRILPLVTKRHKNITHGVGQKINVKNGLAYVCSWGCWASSWFPFASRVPDLRVPTLSASSASRTWTSWASSGALAERRQRMPGRGLRSPGGTPPAAGRAGPSRRPTRPPPIGPRAFRGLAHLSVVLDTSAFPPTEASVCAGSCILSSW